MYGRHTMNGAAVAIAEFGLMALRHLHPAASLERFSIRPEFNLEGGGADYGNRTGWDSLSHHLRRYQKFDAFASVRTPSHAFQADIHGEVFNNVGVWEPGDLTVIDREFTYKVRFRWAPDRGFEIADASVQR